MMFFLASALRVIGFVYVLRLVAAGRLRRGELGWRADALGHELVRGLVGFAAIAALLVAMLAAAGMPPGEVVDAIRDATLGDRLTFLAIGIGAAVVEETIFRGWMQRALARRIGVPRAIAIVAVIFAVSHLQAAPLALAGKLAIGLVLGGLRGGDRSLVGPAIAHALVWSTFGAL